MRSFISAAIVPLAVALDPHSEQAPLIRSEVTVHSDGNVVEEPTVSATQTKVETEAELDASFEKYLVDNKRILSREDIIAMDISALAQKTTHKQSPEQQHYTASWVAPGTLPRLDNATATSDSAPFLAHVQKDLMDEGYNPRFTKPTSDPAKVPYLARTRRVYPVEDVGFAKVQTKIAEGLSENSTEVQSLQQQFRQMMYRFDRFQTVAADAL